MYEYLQIGIITNTHGVKGELKVMPLTDDKTRYDYLEWIFMEKNGVMEKCFIEFVKYSNNFIILKIKGIDTMEAAQALKGTYLMVDRKNAVTLPENSYFICDLIDFPVYDQDNKLLGKLTDVLNTGSNDVYVIRDDSGTELLLPALKSVVKEISIKEGIMKVSVPEGL